MHSENDDPEVFYCDDDGECRLYCNLCNKIPIERFFKNHLKSQTHTNNVRRREQLNKCFQNIPIQMTMDSFCDVRDKTIKLKSKKTSKISHTNSIRKIFSNKSYYQKFIFLRQR